ncbi:MAG: NAD(P)-dependent oxidoreductase [Sandaracinaceae bacterium]|nr:NAD(P)-dependent oxidoreductase [Sandaracinaceae bacterium]
MRVLVTGATGFVGEWLVRALVARGHEVVAFARASSRTEGIEALGASVRRGAFDDPGSLARAVDGVDAVAHLAGGGIARSDEEIYVNNTGSTRALFGAARDAAVRRFVLVSSLTARDAISHYGRSKRAAERVVLEDTSGPSVMVLRPPALYGPGEHRMVPLFAAARRGVVPTVHPRGTLSMLHGADCAEAIACALESEARGVVFVGEERVYGRREMAEIVGRAVGRRVRVVAIPPPALRVAARASELVGRLRDRPVMFGVDKTRDVLQPHQVGDPREAFARLGWRPTRDFERGAREALEDYVARGWLTDTPDRRRRPRSPTAPT